MRQFPHEREKRCLQASCLPGADASDSYVSSNWAYDRRKLLDKTAFLDFDVVLRSDTGLGFEVIPRAG